MNFHATAKYRIPLEMYWNDPFKDKVFYYIKWNCYHEKLNKPWNMVWVKNVFVVFFFDLYRTQSI